MLHETIWKLVIRGQQAGGGHLAEPEELHGSLIVLALVDLKSPAASQAKGGHGVRKGLIASIIDCTGGCRPWPVDFQATCPGRCATAHRATFFATHDLSGGAEKFRCSLGEWLETTASSILCVQDRTVAFVEAQRRGFFACGPKLDRLQRCRGLGRSC